MSKKKSKKTAKSIRVLHLHVTPVAELTINPKEHAVLVACVRAKAPTSNGDLAKAFHGGRGKNHTKEWKQAHSWARNCIRRLVAERLVRRVGRGTFSATPRGVELARRPVAAVVEIKRKAA